MMRLELETVTPSCVLVRGYGAREVIKDAVGRAPVWATRSRAWVTQPSKVADIAAEAERRGYLVVATDRLPTKVERDLDFQTDIDPKSMSDSVIDLAEAPEVLW